MISGLSFDFRYLVIVFGYISFILIAGGITQIRQWILSKRKTGDAKSTVKDKAPGYLLINLIFIIALISPKNLKAFPILLAVIAAGASWEFIRNVLSKERFPYELPVLSMSMTILAGFVEPASFVAVMMVVQLVFIAVYALIKQSIKLGSYYLAQGASLFYLPLCLAAFIWIWNMDSTGFLAIFFYLVIVVNDMFAQVTGELLGRIKLAPILSPAKTIEGTFGGWFFAAAAGLVFSQLPGRSLMWGGLFGLVLGISGTLGDLVVSAWKRALGIKDFSALLGAQGGILDRFDALLFAAPVFYVLLDLSTR